MPSAWKVARSLLDSWSRPQFKWTFSGWTLTHFFLLWMSVENDIQERGSLLTIALEMKVLQRVIFSSFSFITSFSSSLTWNRTSVSSSNLKSRNLSMRWDLDSFFSSLYCPLEHSRYPLQKAYWSRNLQDDQQDSWGGNSCRSGSLIPMRRVSIWILFKVGFLSWNYVVNL